MAFSLLPREDEYFALFTQMAKKIQEASAILVEMLKAPDDQFDSYSKKIKAVEHECDELAHSVSLKLNKSFITPFDREDIYTLSMALDDVCDYIDASARSIVSSSGVVVVDVDVDDNASDPPADVDERRVVGGLASARVGSASSPQLATISDEARVSATTALK